ncbi:protein AAR2 homolog [Lineus longissimus]|uniref:protein AAR2 homolog n=1 Tax=Lineus longissimus TaxID=88925 RepID=UPI002B4C68C1
MNQDQAQVLFHEGAILVFLDVPLGTEFGIDWNSWNVGPKFKGVKMIPPGLHFIYYSATNSDHQAAPRSGFFYNFKAKEVLVKRWDRAAEDVITETISTENQEQFEANKKEMDPFLGVYPYENYKKWVSMTNHMTDDVIRTLEPLEGKILSVTEFLSERSTSQSRKAAKEKAEEEGSEQTSDDSRLPTMQQKEGSQIRFSAIPKKYPENASPAEITKYNMDSSYALEKMIELNYRTDLEILGEIQFSFICFIVGQVYDAFDQWKKLVHLLCSCEGALKNHTELYAQFISVLHYQVREIPEDFFVDIVSANNFLTSTMQILFSNMESGDIDEGLRKRGLNFREHLTKKFKWDFMEEPDEDAPVVVETE